jgi:hypothetical protein
MHQPEVALLDQIEERQVRTLVSLRDMNDESQIRLYEPLPGGVAELRGATKLEYRRLSVVFTSLERAARRGAGLDLLSEAHFLISSQ